MQTLVVDTNIVLDLFVFADAASAPLRTALQQRRVEWFATAAMREELARVLAYPHLASRLNFHALQAGSVLAAFDDHARIVAVPPKAAVTCRDPDDQKFIDLAVARGGWLLSKDRAVLALRKRLALRDVRAQPTFDLEAFA